MKMENIHWKTERQFRKQSDIKEIKMQKKNHRKDPRASSENVRSKK